MSLFWYCEQLLDSDPKRTVESYMDVTITLFSRKEKAWGTPTAKVRQFVHENDGACNKTASWYCHGVFETLVLERGQKNKLNCEETREAGMGTSKSRSNV